MKRAASLGKTQKQAARGIFILGVFLDQAGVLESLEDLFIGDVALHGSFEGMPTEIELSGPELKEDLLEGLHVREIIPERM
jgi:hypothetical protein